MDTLQPIRVQWFLALIILFVFAPTGVSGQEYVTVHARRGDGIFSMLRRYDLPTSLSYRQHFKALNESVLGSSEELFLGVSYRLPVRIIQYNGKSIQSTLGISDYQRAKSIQDFNKGLYRKGLKPRPYTQDLELWVPDVDFVPKARQTQHVPTGVHGVFPIFGKKYEKVDFLDNQLAGQVFYIVCGHGGPDPGAVGRRGRYSMHEDEYAYDVGLRLGRRLLEHGAKVYIVVRDRNDGIRDQSILVGDRDEYYFGGSRISSNPVRRLRQRAHVLNTLYNKNRSSATRQTALVLHLDSRPNTQRIDIFYYFQKNSSDSKRLATLLYRKVKREYDEHQPGRGYKGLVTTRNLYMLRESKPTTVYIELGNIRNTRDQDRFVDTNNRQAVANWLCEGLLEYSP